MNLENNLKILTNNGVSYAFDTHQILLCQIDNIHKACMNAIAEDKDVTELYKDYSRNEIDNAMCEIREYIEAGIFFSKEETKYVVERNKQVGCFSFTPEHACNLNCKYCFAESGRNFKDQNKGFSKEMLERAYEFVIYELFPDMEGYRIDFVGGGEPLLNFEIIKETIKLRNIFQERTGKKIDIFLATNATLLSQEKLNFLSKNNVDLGISIDGKKSVHDSCRIYKNGLNGTYDKVVKTIEKIQNDKNLTRRIKNIWGLGVIHANNIEVLDNLYQYKELGLKSVQMKVVRLKKSHPLSINNNNVEDLLYNYEKLTLAILEEIGEKKLSLLYMFLNDNDYYGKIILRLLLRRPVIYRCAAGKNKISICANGDIYPCDSFVGNKLFLLGNIEKSVDKKKVCEFYKYSIYESEKCKNCWIRHVCGGDCYHNSFLVNGKVNIPDSLICYINESLAEKAIRILIELEKDEKLSQCVIQRLNARVDTY